MQKVSAELAPSELRELRRTLSSITDARLIQVVALIDRMVERGTADELIGPFRTRLGQIRPPRPLRFTRLLFLPLDPVIVSAPRFRAGTPTVPRTALPSFANVVRAALGGRVHEIEADLAGRAAEDTDTVQQVGDVLWPEAATILARAPRPPGWVDAGLPAVLHESLARGISAVLQQAATLHVIVADVAAGLPIDIGVVDAILTKAVANGPAAWGFVLAVLLGRMPDADAVLRQTSAWATRHSDAALHAAMDLVSETQLARLESDDGFSAEMSAFNLAEAGIQVRRVLGLLDGLDVETTPAPRRARLEAIRSRLDTSCRSRFANSLAGEFLAPLHELRQAPEPGAPQRLEESARQLRALETEARRLGSAPTYDALLRETAVVVRSLAPDAGLTLAEKVRLIEILAGPDEALALLA